MKNFEQDFRKWYESQGDKYKGSDNGVYTFFGFDKLSDSMKWGVYVDFLLEKSIWIEFENMPPFYDIWVVHNEGSAFVGAHFDNMAEARKAALEKAIEIYNQ